MARTGRKLTKHGKREHTTLRIDPDIKAWLKESGNMSDLANRCLRREMYRILDLKRGSLIASASRRDSP